MRRNFSVERDAFGKYTTRLIAKETSQVIANHNPAVPMFLYIAHLAVHSANSHSPLQAPRETIEMFPHIENMDRRRFAGFLIYYSVWLKIWLNLYFIKMLFVFNISSYGLRTGLDRWAAGTRSSNQKNACKFYHYF